MEDGHPAAPSHSPVPDHHPLHEPTAVVGDEEQHHEKKSFMTRIQNKVNKLKHNYHKKRHAHDQVSEVPVEEESEEFDDTNEDMDVDSVGSNLSVYEFIATSREFDCEPGPLVTPETVEPHILDDRDEPPVTLETDKSHVPGGGDTLETDKPYVLGGRDELETDKPHVSGGRDTLETDKSYILGGRDEPPVTLETDKPHVLGGRDEPPVTPKTMKATTMEEETVAPLPYGSLPCTTDADADADAKLTTSVGLTPVNESSVLPEVLSSMSEQWRYQQPSEAQPGPEDETLVNHMLSDMEKKPNYTEKLSTTAAADEAAVSAASMEYSAGTVSGPTGTPPPSYSEKFSSTAFAAKDAAAASMVYGKVGGKEKGTHSRETGGEVVTPVSNVSGTEEVAGEKKESYADRLSGSAYAAKDAAVMAASTMYGMMMGAGAAMMGNVVETEKLQPAEEDKAASEVVPESMQKVGEEDEVVKGRIELPEVTSREVVSDAPAEVLTDGPPAVDKKSGGYTGQGMVEMITGAVTSFVGGRGGAADAPAAAAEAPSGGTADAPASASGGGGTGGVAVAPAVAVEAPSGGAGKERVSEGLGY